MKLELKRNGKVIATGRYEHCMDVMMTDIYNYGHQYTYTVNLIKDQSFDIREELPNYMGHHNFTKKDIDTLKHYKDNCLNYDLDFNETIRLFDSLDDFTTWIYFDNDSTALSQMMHFLIELIKDDTREVDPQAVLLGDTAKLLESGLVVFSFEQNILYE